LANSESTGFHSVSVVIGTPGSGSTGSAATTTPLLTDTRVHRVISTGQKHMVLIS
jgi:hypothetical protein